MRDTRPDWLKREHRRIDIISAVWLALSVGFAVMVVWVKSLTP